MRAVLSLYTNSRYIHYFMHTLIRSPRRRTPQLGADSPFVCLPPHTRVVPGTKDANIHPEASTLDMVFIAQRCRMVKCAGHSAPCQSVQVGSGVPRQQESKGHVCLSRRLHDTAPQIRVFVCAGSFTVTRLPAVHQREESPPTSFYVSCSTLFRLLQLLRGRAGLRACTLCSRGVINYITRWWPYVQQ